MYITPLTIDSIDPLVPQPDAAASFADFQLHASFIHNHFLQSKILLRLPVPLLPCRAGAHAKTASPLRLFGLLWTQLALLRLHFRLLEYSLDLGECRINLFTFAHAKERPSIACVVWVPRLEYLLQLPVCSVGECLWSYGTSLYYQKLSISNQILVTCQEKYFHHPTFLKSPHIPPCSQASGLFPVLIFPALVN
jgi:hypothetical protein